MKYVTSDNNSPYEPAVTTSAIAFAAVMNLTIYIPAMYFHMKDSSNNHADRQALRWPYKLLYLFHYKVLGYASILNSGFGAYLNSLSLIERIFGLEEDKLNTQQISALEATALAFAIGNMYSNISRRLKSYEENTYTFATCLQERNLPNNKYVYYTAAVSFFGVACSPYMGYFSGTHALKRIHGLKISEKANLLFGIYSAVTMTNFQIFTQPPAIYQKLKNRHELVQIEQRHTLDKPISFITKTVGVSDSLTSGTSNFIAIILTSEEAFSLNPKNPALVTVAVVASCSTAVMQYYFGVLETYNRVRDDYYRLHGNQDAKVYLPVSSSDENIDVEAGDNPSPHQTTARLAIVGMGGLFDLPGSVNTTALASVSQRASNL